VFRSTTQVIDYLQQGPTFKTTSPETTERTIIELDTCIEDLIAEKILKSTSWGIGIDGSGTGLGRQFVEFYGASTPSDFWCYLVRFAEDSKYTGKGAQGELDLIKDKSIVYDTPVQTQDVMLGLEYLWML